MTKDTLPFEKTLSRIDAISKAVVYMCSAAIGIRNFVGKGVPENAKCLRGRSSCRLTAAPWPPANVVDDLCS